jgi:hypothetical protein
METCIQARNKVVGETIVDPRAVIIAKEEPGLALRIPDDVPPAVPGAGEEQSPLWRRVHGLLLSSSDGQDGPRSPFGCAGT